MTNEEALDRILHECATLNMWAQGADENDFVIGVKASYCDQMQWQLREAVTVLERAVTNKKYKIVGKAWLYVIEMGTHCWVPWESASSKNLEALQAELDKQRRSNLYSPENYIAVSDRDGNFSVKEAP